MLKMYLSDGSTHMWTLTKTQRNEKNHFVTIYPWIVLCDAALPVRVGTVHVSATDTAWSTPTVALVNPAWPGWMWRWSELKACGVTISARRTDTLKSSTLTKNIQHQWSGTTTFPNGTTWFALRPLTYKEECEWPSSQKDVFSPPSARISKCIRELVLTDLHNLLWVSEYRWMLFLPLFPSQKVNFWGLGSGQRLEWRPAGPCGGHPHGGSQYQQAIRPKARHAARPAVCGVRSQPEGVAVRAVRRLAELRRRDGIHGGGSGGALGLRVAGAGGWWCSSQICALNFPLTVCGMFQIKSTGLPFKHFYKKLSELKFRDLNVTKVNVLES